ncbi:MAG: regulatory protein RecX [Chloroflexota bacterium]
MADSPHRPRKPTFAERRERRAAVEDLGEVVDFAARFLETRPRSVTEVRRRLASAGFRTELVEAAISRLGELGYLDDETFARAWVESRDRAHPRGEHALRRELQLKGVDRSIVDGVLEARAGDAAAGEPDLAAAERLLARNRSALERVADPRRRRQRAYALLARHGFAPSIASEVARRVADGGPDDVDTEGP